MAQTLTKLIADFSTTLVSKTAVGATSLTLTSATDSDGVAIPAGTYAFTIDRKNSSKEHFTASLSGTALTSIKTIARGTGAGTSGLLRIHRKGAEIIMSDFVSIKRMLDVLDGTTDFDSATPLAYDGVATLTPGSNELATVAYVDGVAIAGASNASTTTKGIVEEATQAEVDAGTTAGGTSARLFVNPSTVRAKMHHDYAADSVGTDAYAITITPAITAYTAGQRFIFKAGTANTGAATLNVSGLGAKNILKAHDQALETGDIEADQIVEVVYDGTSMQMVSQTGTPGATVAQVQNGSTVYAADSVGTDSYAIALTPTLTAYAAGQKFIFKAGTANTGAATLNVDSLGAKNIKKMNDQDLVTGDIESGQIVEVVYDGTSMQMTSQTAFSPAFACGTQSHDLSSETADTIAHGLGRAPSRVAIYWMQGNGTSGSASSGVYTASGNKGVYVTQNPAGSSSGGVLTSYIIRAYPPGDITNSNAATVTVDATNITVSWSKNGSPTGTYSYMWEAQA